VEKGLFGDEMIALFRHLVVDERDRHLHQHVDQLIPAGRILQHIRIELLQGREGLLTEGIDHLRHGLFGEERKGIGDQILDVLEVIGGRGQRHLGLIGHGPVAYIADAVAHDNAQRRLQNILAPLLTARAAGLATLILNRRCHAGTPFLLIARRRCSMIQNRAVTTSPVAQS
jgi:hypothetical protein